MQMRAERIIHLDDMCFYMIRRWKIFLAVMVIVGVLFGGIGWSKVSRKYTADQKEQKIEVKAPNGDLSNIEMILYLENTIEELQSYLEKSILMGINPYKEWAAVLKYQFTASGRMEPEIYVNMLEQGRIAFQTEFNSENIYVFIRKKLDLEKETEYLKELVSFDVSTNGMVVIRIIAPDREMAQMLQAAVKEYLQENERQILQNYRNINAELDSEYLTSVVDTRLSDTQRAQYNNVQSLQTSLDQKRMLLSSEGKEYLSLARKKLNEGTYQMGQTLYKTSPKKGDVSPKRKLYEAGLYAFKRVLLAAGLLIMFFALKYMWSPWLLCADDLRDMYGVKVLDILETGDADRTAIAAEKIKACTDGRNVTITGSNVTQSCSEWMQGLTGELKVRNISADVLHKTDTLEALKALQVSDDVIIVETFGKSKYNSIKKLVEELRCLGRDIRGAIILKDSK